MTTAGETLPLLRDTATRVRDDRAAPIRSAGEASSSGRGSKKPYRVLASIGAASLGLMLVAGTALGRGGLDGHLHLTSLGEAARGKARVSRHKGHGATVGAAHHASASMGTGSGSLGDITLEPRGIGQMPRADPIRPPQEQAADRQRETGAFTGVARCVNQTCKAFDASLPIALRIEVKEMRSEDTPALKRAA